MGKQKKPVTRPKKPEISPKDLLRKAEKTAAAGDQNGAIDLFESCIREYLKNRMPFKALAAAKIANKALRKHPRAHAMLIRHLLSMNLNGEAAKEFSESPLARIKDSVSLFQGLTMNEFIDLMDVMQIAHAGKGSFVIRQGDQGQDLYIVVSGTLEVKRDGARLAAMNAGDVFGELGFFSGAIRTATVQAASDCELALIRSQDMQKLCRRHPRLKDSLEAHYHERILKKAGEDLGTNMLVDLKNDILTTFLFPKGQEIPFERPSDITIIKHGIVEITFAEKGLSTKRFLKPGNVIGSFSGTARASTDVELIRARIDLLGSGKRDGES